MVVVSMLPHGEFGPNDHYEISPHRYHYLTWFENKFLNWMVYNFYNRPDLIKGRKLTKCCSISTRFGRVLEFEATVIFDWTKTQISIENYICVFHWWQDLKRFFPYRTFHWISSDLVKEAGPVIVCRFGVRTCDRNDSLMKVACRLGCGKDWFLRNSKRDPLNSSGSSWSWYWVWRSESYRKDSDSDRIVVRGSLLFIVAQKIV